MVKKEVVVCAAIKKWVGHESKIHLCIRYPSGYLLRKNEARDVGYELGFITSKERFVSQEEALEISGLGNQLRFKYRRYLLPEDLY